MGMEVVLLDLVREIKFNSVPYTGISSTTNGFNIYSCCLVEFGCRISTSIMFDPKQLETIDQQKIVFSIDVLFTNQKFSSDYLTEFIDYARKILKEKQKEND